MVTSFALLALLAAPAAGQVPVSAVQEAIDRWSPDTHVYVMGDVGLEPDALAELESWLAGGHWTVLLVQDATGQRFQDIDGVMREGVDAIEYGTGQGMARAAGFASQTHPKTGEPDGTILSIVLAQRALYYTGSGAQDDRGLGEAAFANNLDRWAIEAMRNGGDIAGAVRNTVNNVDSLLASEIGRGPREAREAIADAEEALKSLEEAAAALRAAPSHPAGSLAHPDTRSLLEDLDRARTRVEAEPAAARELALDVLRRIGSMHEPIRQYGLAAPRFDEGWRQFRELHKKELSTVAGEPLERSRLALVEGQALYRNADPAYGARLDRALQALSEARGAIDLAERRASAERFTRSLVGWLAIFTVISIAWGLNRRRARVKEEAEALLASWETALGPEGEAIVREMEQRIALLAGPISGQDPGTQTGALAESVRTDVDALITLRTSARATLEMAEEHIRPQRTTERVANLLLPGHYREGIALLRDEREMKSELDTLAVRAAQGLDDLETALTKMPQLLESLQGRVRPVPVAEAALEEARRTMADDPVKALREVRRAARAIELSDRLQQARSEIEAGENRIEAARRELGAALGLDPWSLLRETDQNPCEHLDEAVRQVEAARAALGQGSFDGAGSALEQAKRLTLGASALVDRTLEAGRSWERETRERQAETERLAALVPEHEALAARMREEFGQNDQSLASGGLHGARHEIAAARRALDAATAPLREGRILAAAALLRQVGAHQEQAGRSLAEIRDELGHLIEEALAAERAHQERLRRLNEEVQSSGSSSESYSSSSSGSSSDHGDSGSSASDSSSGAGSSSWGSSSSNSGRSGW